VRPFEEKHISLLKTFADQAAIAIENVRLFDEVQAKARDLTEALTYQTGSANILKVIASSPTDVEPVLNAIVESACELCDSNDAAVLLKDGDDLRFRAHHGPIDINVEKWPINRRWTAGRAFLDGEPVHLRDAWSEEGKEFPDGKALSDATNSADIRTLLSVPLMRDNDRVGAIVLRRTEMRPFSDKQINLLKTFADQAVIAIGNVRLFDEVQARTRDLTESLQQQTATADVLKVISASPGELEPVFHAMLENAARLCEAKLPCCSCMKKLSFAPSESGTYRQAMLSFWRKITILADPKVPLGRIVMTKQPVHVEDVLLDQSYIEGFPGMVGVAEGGGARTLLQVPMFKENDLVGTVGIYRQEVRPFTDKQIAL
jgi:GAF domain-containing protein